MFIHNSLNRSVKKHIEGMMKGGEVKEIKSIPERYI
jgi:hypothetical protein